MQINSHNIYDKVKLELNENYINEIIKRYTKMSNSCSERTIIPVDTTKFEIYKALHSFLRTDFSDTKSRYTDLSDLNNKILMDSINNNTLTYINHNGYKTNPITGNQLGWKTYQSWHLVNNKKYNKEEISHRFYIDIDPTYISDFVSILYKYFKEKDCAFYFKVNDSAVAKDKIVIYSSTENLDHTLDVLKRLEDENKELISKCKTPHIYVGNIDNWLGYSNEFKDNQKISYTSRMSKILSDSIEESVTNWTNKHNNYLININGEKTKLNKYFNKDLYKNKPMKEQREGYIDYIKRIAILLNTIPKIDSNFKSDLYNLVREKLKSNHIDLENICFNEEVIEELKNIDFKNSKLNEMLNDTKIDNSINKIQR